MADGPHNPCEASLTRVSSDSPFIDKYRDTSIPFSYPDHAGHAGHTGESGDEILPFSNPKRLNESGDDIAFSNPMNFHSGTADGTFSDNELRGTLDTYEYLVECYQQKRCRGGTIGDPINLFIQTRDDLRILLNICQGNSNRIYWKGIAEDPEGKDMIHFNDPKMSGARKVSFDTAVGQKMRLFAIQARLLGLALDPTPQITTMDELEKYYGDLRDDASQADATHKKRQHYTDFIETVIAFSEENNDEKFALRIVGTTDLKELGIP